MKLIAVFILSSVLCVHVCLSQDSLYPRYLIENLCSNKFAGRGYVSHGDLKAARFISKELEKMHIKPWQKNYYQEFSFPMNTFPDAMNVSLDGTIIKPVVDYVVSPDCKTNQGTYEMFYLPECCDTNDLIFDSLKKVDYTGKIVVAPFKKRSWKTGNPFHSAGWIIPKEPVFWWASTGHCIGETSLLFIQDSLLHPKPKSIKLDIKNQFIDSYQTQNVLGYLQGSQFPDSFIVLSAHYDHLGMMGNKSIFRGANDNASGTAMVLALASYFSQTQNRPKYSIAFLFFAAEESGLLGSMHYVSNPVFPLKQIKALVNLDMVGSGSEGISIVNGEANPGITNKLKSINNQYRYLSDIHIGGESSNSDHHPFHKAGVPAIFIFTRGPECKEYHNLRDIPETLPLTRFSDLQKLLIDWVEQ